MNRRWLIIPLVAAVAAPATAVANPDGSAEPPTQGQTQAPRHTAIDGFARRLDVDAERVRASIPGALRDAWSSDRPSGDRPWDQLRDRFLNELAERLDRPADRVADAADAEVRADTARAVDAGVMTEEQRQEVLEWWSDPDSGPRPFPGARGGAAWNGQGERA